MELGFRGRSRADLESKLEEKQHEMGGALEQQTIR